MKKEKILTTGGSGFVGTNLIDKLSNEKYGVFRGTGVLIKIDNNWLITQYNLLLPIPNDLLKDYSKEIINFLKKE